MMSGKRRSNLINDTDTDTNAKSESLMLLMLYLKLIKPDDTARHTHALTGFSVKSISYTDNNSTLYIGNSTVGFKEG